MRNLILKDEAKREQVEEAIRSLGFNLRPPEKTQVLNDMFRQIWMAPDEKSAVQYVEDGVTEVRYLSVRGKRVPTYAKRLRAALPIWGHDALLKHTLDLLADGSEADRRRFAMAVVAQMDGDDYDAAAAGVLNTFLYMDEPATRRAGIRALRALPLPYFLETARKFANDADPEVAEVARALLARIIELHGE